MQNQYLINGLEEFFQSSYPASSTVTSVSAGTSSIESTAVASVSGSNGNKIIKTIAVGGLICLVFYFINKINNQDEED